MRPLTHCVALACVLIVSIVALPLGSATAQIARTVGPNPLVIEEGSHAHQHGYEVTLPDPSTLGGAFTLVDQNGNTVTDRTLQGRWSLIYFGYAACKEACPIALKTIAASIDHLGSDGASIQPILVDFSVVYSRMHKEHAEHQPKIDPVEFANDIHPRLLLLSGSRKNMFEALRHYRVRQEHSPLAYGRKEKGLRIDHTTWIYLVDPEGKVAAFYYHNIAPDVLAADISARLKG
jgi:protein SCO1/2